METQNCNPSYKSPHWALYSLPFAAATFIAPKSVFLGSSLLFLSGFVSPTKEWHSNPKFRHLKLHFFEGAMVGWLACAARSLLRIEITGAIGNLVSAGVMSIAANRMRASAPPAQPQQPAQLARPTQPEPRREIPPGLMEYLTSTAPFPTGSQHGQMRMFNSVIKYWDAPRGQWVERKEDLTKRSMGSFDTLRSPDHPWTN